MCTVIVLFSYIAFRALTFVTIGVSAVGHFRSSTPYYEPCPKTSRIDESVDAIQYVNPSTDLAKKYESNITGNDLFENNSLQAINQNGNPEGFEEPVNSEAVILDVQTASDGSRYLRSKVLKHSDSNIGMAWLTKFMSVKYGNSYYFSYEYRSDTEASMLVQYKEKEDKFSYQSLNTLDISSGWKKVSGSFSVIDKDFEGARVLVNPKGNGIVDLRKFSVHMLNPHPLKEPIISVTFDDGWRSVYTEGLPIFDKYRIRTTQYIIPSFAIRDTSLYMSMRQIKDMQSSGHEIGMHSLQHCDLTQLTGVQLERDVQQAQSILLKNGLNTKMGFAYPFGAYNKNTSEILQKKLAYLRTSDDGFNDYYSDLTRIKVKSVEHDTTIDELKTWVNTAKQHNQWLILLYHRVGESGEYNIAPDDLDEHMSILRNTNIKILPVEAAVKYLDL